MSYNLILPKNYPLIKLQDLFVSYDKNAENKFVLNILMEKADCDLYDYLVKRKNFPLNFSQFFPIFKQTIIGLTFLHIQGIVHRDIKS